VLPFGELRQFLNGLGFAAKRSESAWVLHHAREGLLVFRLYGQDEPVDEHDVVSTRTFLDMRELLDRKDFDAFLQRATTPA
jgi:hypothetical protein